MSVESWIAYASRPPFIILVRETEIAGALFVMRSCYTGHDPLLSELMGVCIQGVTRVYFICVSELGYCLLNFITHPALVCKQ